MHDYLHHLAMPTLFFSLVTIGPPLPPTPRLTVVNATHLKISWDPPFLLAGDKYPVQYYQVHVTNSTSNEVLKDEQVNGTHTIYSIPAVAETCQPLSFNVTATTSVGTSVPAVEEGGFPIGNFTYCEWHYDSLNFFPPSDTIMIWCHHGHDLSISL